MTRYVVDASVAVKWFLPEVHDPEALRLLSDDTELLAPDLVVSEVGNILWKRVRAGDVSETEGEAVLQAFGRLRLAITPSASLILPAFAIACQTQRTVYDSQYLALALRESALLVTADEKFCNALAGTPLARSVLWIGDVPDVADPKQPS